MVSIGVSTHAGQQDEGCHWRVSCHKYVSFQGVILALKANIKNASRGYMQTKRGFTGSD